MEPTTIQPESFFRLSDPEALLLIRDNFGPELACLKRVSSRPEPPSAKPSTASPSQILFDAQYDEVNRTLVGILALRWLHNGQYDVFVAGQSPTERLSRASFEWMRAFFIDAVGDKQKLDALITSVMINDLGKDKTLATRYRERTGIEISALNHDAILLRAVDADLVPCLDRLSAHQKEAVVRGLRLGADFNFGQLAQAENAPSCLSVLRSMQGQSYAFNLHFMEQLLDIASAAGHLDWTCAKKMIEPILQAYRSTYDVAVSVIKGSLSPREGYDRILIHRAEDLREKGFRSLSVDVPDHRALMRLLCMGGASSLEMAELFDDTWTDLEISTKDILVAALNVDGASGAPAIQPTYMPALLTQAVNEDGLKTQEEKKKVLLSCLRYMARVMTLEGEWDGSATVIERDVLNVLKDVVQSPGFRVDPTILERAVVPDGIVCLRQ
jgi:hypothetical protein